MSSIISQAPSKLVAQWTATPQWLRLTSILTISTLSLLTANLIYGYRRWKAMGAGGLPFNLKGYLMNVMIETLYARRDTTSLGVYERPERFYVKWEEVGEGEREVVMNKKFLKGALEERKGVRAKAKTFAIPQRERDANERGDEKIREAYLSAFDDLAMSNPNTTEWKTSVLERRGKALFLKPAVPLRVLDQQTKRETCHIHASDLSGHVTLALADAKEVVRRGYGERHRLSGTKFLPLGYTMMYVPRTIDEIEIYRSIFQAGVDYMASAK